MALQMGSVPAIPPIDAEQVILSGYATTTAVAAWPDVERKEQSAANITTGKLPRKKPREAYLTHNLKTADCAEKQALQYTN